MSKPHTKPQPKADKADKTNKTRKILIIILIILILICAGVGVWWFCFAQKDENGNFIGIGIGTGSNTDQPIYSKFTGLEITNESENSAPTFCVQIPNGSTDGARPQAGLTHAGVVFEAIAETGITRFAAVFQNPQTSVIGPIRSLRPYYLDWDTPFDCTVVHDGGSPEALAAIRNGGQRNLDEDFNYMWKENDASRLWNNVFTSPNRLLNFNNNNGYTTSSPKTFPRLTPDYTPSTAEPCDEEATNECITDELATSITTTFTGLIDYNVNYRYSSDSNTYLRSYGNGNAHMVYDCAANLTEPYTGDCSLVQVAPSAVVIMRVQEHTMSDNYHESITTIGSGTAYIFQNGRLIEGKWSKSNQSAQIKFTDASGEEVAFVPGQVWIAAVPQFGSVNWD